MTPQQQWRLFCRVNHVACTKNEEDKDDGEEIVKGPVSVADDE